MTKNIDWVDVLLHALNAVFTMAQAAIVAVMWNQGHTSWAIGTATCYILFAIDGVRYKLRDMA